MIVRVPTTYTNTKGYIDLISLLLLLFTTAYYARLYYAYFCAKKQSMEWEKSESEKSNNISLQLALLQKRQSIERFRIRV